MEEQKDVVNDVNLPPVDVRKQKKSSDVTRQVSLSTAFLAGAAAGLAVDIGLYPLDTLKTRLQSSKGFWGSGGFRGIYQGIGPVVLSSAPTAAVFFCTYNSFKKYFQPHVTPNQEPFLHVAAAVTAEVVSCIVRVPSDVLKQRRQACCNENTVRRMIKSIWKREGFFGFYRGFFSTIVRDIPYAGIQFPLWEWIKVELALYKNSDVITPKEGALCGAIAGAIAGAFTTPLDVIKTRLMLYDVVTSKRKKPPSFVKITRTIYKEKGIRGFFSGFTPRFVWIGAGGCIFFGVYEEVILYLEPPPPPVQKAWWERFIFW